MRLARNAADVVSHGFEGVKDNASDRERRKGDLDQQTGRTHCTIPTSSSVTPTQYHGSGRRVEDRCRYTIRDIEAKEVAYHAQNYGAKVMRTYAREKMKTEKKSWDWVSTRWWP